MSTRDIHPYHTQSFDKHRPRSPAYPPTQSHKDHHYSHYPAYPQHHQQYRSHPEHPPPHHHHPTHRDQHSPRYIPHPAPAARSTSYSGERPSSRTENTKPAHPDYYQRPPLHEAPRYLPIPSASHHELDPYYRSLTSRPSLNRQPSHHRLGLETTEHRPQSLPSISSFDTGRSVNADRTLAPLRIVTPTSHPHVKREPINHPDPYYLTPHYDPSNRKRQRDEKSTDLFQPGPSSPRRKPPTPRPHSSRHSPKRRQNTINSLLINDDEKVDIKPTLSPTSSIWSHDSTSSLRSITELTDLPPPSRLPIPSIKMSQQWNGPPIFTQLANTNPTAGPASGGSNPERPGGIAIDPALSSVRSGQSNPSGPNSPGMHLAPELRFTDETLASAIIDPDVAALGNMGMDSENTKEEEVGGGSGSGGLEVPEKKDQPFSRSPELRVSHKLAERKRRKEMKDMFEELSALLPAERGTKSSKWEILSKSIDYVISLKTMLTEAQKQNENLKRELEVARGATNGNGNNNVPASSPYAHNPYYAISPAFTPQASGSAYPTSTPASAASGAGGLAQQQSMSVGLGGAGVDGGLGAGLVGQQQGLGVGQTQSVGVGQMGTAEIQ